LSASAVVKLILGHDQRVDTPGGTLANQVIQAAEQEIVPADFPDNYLKREQERLIADS
jgi:hypothetical protein